MLLMIKTKTITKRKYFCLPAKQQDFLVFCQKITTVYVMFKSLFLAMRDENNCSSCHQIWIKYHSGDCFYIHVFPVIFFLNLFLIAFSFPNIILVHFLIIVFKKGRIQSMNQKLKFLEYFKTHYIILNPMAVILFESAIIAIHEVST